ncbi:MAG TPA: alpha/beta fold hydrolase, partial [Chroococcales cyanobacterium]
MLFRKKSALCSFSVSLAISLNAVALLPGLAADSPTDDPAVDAAVAVPSQAVAPTESGEAKQSAAQKEPAAQNESTDPKESSVETVDRQAEEPKEPAAPLGTKSRAVRCDPQEELKKGKHLNKKGPVKAGKGSATASEKEPKTGESEIKASGRAGAADSGEAKVPTGPICTDTRDEGDIPIRSWRSAKELPWAALLCIHGFGLSMNSYDRFGQRMADLGIPTYAIDVRGFGNWQNAKGHTDLDFDDAIGDVQKALKAIRKAHPNLPLYLVGESMGGALALQAMAADQSLAQGLICSVPAQDRFGEKAEDARVALAMLKGFNHRINMGTTVMKQLTANPALRKDIQNETGSRMDFSPKDLLRFQHFMNQTDKRARMLTSVPTLILQGGSDRLVKPRGTGLVFMNLAAKNKDFVLIGSSEHLLLEESQFNDHVIDVLTSWIYENSALRKLMDRSLPSNPGSEHQPADIVKAGGHLRIAQGLLDLGEQSEAEKHLRMAIAIGKGTPLATTAV